MTQGKLINGIWYSTKELKAGKHLKRNNPKGFNKHKADPTPKEKAKPITKADIQQAYREMWKAKNEYLSKTAKFNNLESKFFDFDKIKKEG